MVDAAVSKTVGAKSPCRFESGLRHHSAVVAVGNVVRKPLRARPALDRWVSRRATSCPRTRASIPALPFWIPARGQEWLIHGGNCLRRNHPCESRGLPPQRPYLPFVVSLSNHMNGGYRRGHPLRRASMMASACSGPTTYSPSGVLHHSGPIGTPLSSKHCWSSATPRVEVSDRGGHDMRVVYCKGKID